MRNKAFGVVSLAIGFLGCGSGENVAGTGGNGGDNATGGGGAGGGSSTCGAKVEIKPGTVLTKTGAIVGEKAGTTWAFKSIPYAAPPVGDLRWKRPQAHACWEEPLTTTAFPPFCKQVNDTGPVGEEDCLFLNIWTPEDASAEKPLPVMFFIHGGGNTQGGASTQIGPLYLYDGQALSEGGHAVVVTINYRVGQLGWLAHPAFAEGKANASGNYGAHDQVFALKWVKDNIAAFGGDPSKTLVFGESAGALNTCLMLTSPHAKGLFSAALMESAGCTAQPKADAEKVALNWAMAAGCDTEQDVAACLRAMPADDVQQLLWEPVQVAGKQGSYQPHIDGDLMPKNPQEILENGDHNHVAFLAGTNENETAQAVLDMTAVEYEQLVMATFPTVADQVLQQYPVTEFPTPRDAYVAVTSDVKFICPTRRVVRAAKANQTEPVYRYHFTHVLDNVGAMGKKNGAFHGLELFFVFNHLEVAGYKPSAGEIALAKAIEGYWSRFAKSGNPNEAGAVEWPLYEIQKDPYLKLDTPIAADEGVHTTQCDFWDSLIP